MKKRNVIEEQTKRTGERAGESIEVGSVDATRKSVEILENRQTDGMQLKKREGERMLLHCSLLLCKRKEKTYFYRRRPSLLDMDCCFVDPPSFPSLSISRQILFPSRDLRGMQTVWFSSLAFFF